MLVFYRGRESQLCWLACQTNFHAGSCRPTGKLVANSKQSYTDKVIALAACHFDISITMTTTVQRYK